MNRKEKKQMKEFEKTEYNTDYQSDEIGKILKEIKNEISSGLKAVVGARKKDSKEPPFSAFHFIMKLNRLFSILSFRVKMTRHVEFEMTHDEPLVEKNYYGTAGDFVSVAPCDPKFGGKTYLGIYIGDIPLGSTAAITKDKITLKRTSYNPAILVLDGPKDTKKIIYGAESWWGKISKPEDLKQITNMDIQDIWYVKLGKLLGYEPVKLKEEVKTNVKGADSPTATSQDT